MILLRQNTSDKVMSVLFDKLLMKETDLPSNYLNGLKHVCKEDKYAFMTLDNMAALLQQKVDCKLEPLDIISHTTIAMALRSNSPYRGIINSKCVRASLTQIKMIKCCSDKNFCFICCSILMLKDSGIMQRLLETQWSVQLRGANVRTLINFADYHP